MSTAFSADGRVSASFAFLDGFFDDAGSLWIELGHGMGQGMSESDERDIDTHRDVEAIRRFQSTRPP